MNKIRYMKSNAFTAGSSLGNPAASFFLNDEELKPEQMQAIATEHKGFVMEDVWRGIKGMLANLLTGCRIILSLILLYLPVFSSGFYACYLMAGITDMVDGTVARKLGTESEFGERFDTIADFIFVISAMYKLLPAVDISMGIRVLIGVIAVIKVINTMYGIAVQRRFTAIHSLANKMTGFMLFVLPFSFSVIDINYSAAAVCLLATFAAVQEGHVIRCQKG